MNTEEQNIGEEAQRRWGRFLMLAEDADLKFTLGLYRFLTEFVQAAPTCASAAEKEELFNRIRQLESATGGRHASEA